MALQVWLPLNGDLHNQGLNNIETINNGTTVNNSGKIGKCYSFNGSNQKISSTFSSTISSSIGSLACWVKFTQLPSNSSWANIMQLGKLGGFAACRLGIYCEYGSGINISINGSATGKNYKAYSFSTDIWYHICATYDGTKVKLYINGQEQLNKNATLGSYTTAADMLFIGGTNNYYLNGYINDCRYYDHCLSSKEVEEISKGLVLHYKLSETIINPNILTGTYYNSYGSNLAANTTATNALGRWAGGSGGNGTFSVVTDATAPIGGYSWNITNNTTGNRDFQQGDQPYITNQVYTTSFWAKGSGTCLYRSWNSTDGKAMFTKQWTLTTNWKYYTYTFTASAEMETDKCTFHLGVTGKSSISISGMKMELGSVATPWSPAVTDAIYENNNAIIYDCSGYQNNGTIVGTLTAAAGSPRYDTALTFAANSYITESTEFSTTDSTISLWLYPALSANCHILDARNDSGTGKQPIYSYTNGSIQAGGSAQYVTSSTGLLTANTWVHLVLVQQGNSLLIYKNGNLFQTISCTNTPIIKPTIGARYTFANKYNGKISDFRIYTTALTAEQVKELYNTPVSIDASGNIYARELKEV